MYVVYLLPQGCSKYVNIQDFSDRLLTNIYEYKNLGKYIIRGDCNSCIGDIPNYMENVNDITDRNAVDINDINEHMYG